LTRATKAPGLCVHPRVTRIPAFDETSARATSRRYR
jgi:hypothetical protein